MPDATKIWQNKTGRLFLCTACGHTQQTNVGGCQFRCECIELVEIAPIGMAQSVPPDSDGSSPPAGCDIELIRSQATTTPDVHMPMSGTKQRRETIATAIMAALVSSTTNTWEGDRDVPNHPTVTEPSGDHENLAMEAVRFADALLIELDAYND